jgi:hypothetical protein
MQEHSGVREFSEEKAPQQQDAENDRNRDDDDFDQTHNQSFGVGRRRAYGKKCRTKRILVALGVPVNARPRRRRPALNLQMKRITSKLSVQFRESGEAREAGASQAVSLMTLRPRRILPTRLFEA